MQSPDDKTIEFDLYQRYSFLRELLGCALPGGDADGCAVLDVGSGPDALTSRFLGPAFRITCCDVDPRGNPDVVPLRPGEPLAFEDRSFRVVLCLEVLEHVPPEDRNSLIAECVRVASDWVVLTCPNGATEVTAAEERVRQAVQAAFGKPHPFLAEHAPHPLPEREEVLAGFQKAARRAIPFDNVRLDLWEAAAMLDNMLQAASDDMTARRRLYREMNERFAARYRGAPHYRTFYVAAQDEAMLERLQPLIEANLPTASDELLSGEYQMARLAAEFLAVHRDRMKELEESLRNKDAYIEQLLNQIRRIESHPVIRAGRVARKILTRGGKPRADAQDAEPKP